MPLPRIAEVREMSDEEITEAIAEIKKELFNLRLEQVTGRLEKTHLYKHKRHRLGQLLTVERERQINPATTPSKQEDSE